MDSITAEIGIEFYVYWSFRSPYSYLATPGLMQIAEDYEVELNLRVVLPIAVRSKAALFDASNRKPAMYILMDSMRRAQFLGLPYAFPTNPDPVKQDYQTFKVAEDQPLIKRLAKLGVEAQRRGKGLPFAKEVSHLIFGGTDHWDQGDHWKRRSKRAIIWTRSNATIRPWTRLAIGAYQRWS